jgi:hypothetical protein
MALGAMLWSNGLARPQKFHEKWKPMAVLAIRFCHGCLFVRQRAFPMVFILSLGKTTHGRNGWMAVRLYRDHPVLLHIESQVAERRCVCVTAALFQYMHVLAVGWRLRIRPTEHRRRSRGDLHGRPRSHFMLGIRGIGIYLGQLLRISAHAHSNTILLYFTSVSPSNINTKQHPTAAFPDNAFQDFNRPGFALRMLCRRSGNRAIRSRCRSTRSRSTRADQLCGGRRVQSLSVV